MICLLLFGLQILGPMQSPIQAKQTNNYLVNNAISVNLGTDTSAFLSTWNTSAVSFGSSNASQITLPLTVYGTYNFIVKWGDGSQNIITSYNQPEATHTYASPGVYNLNITGLIDGWALYNSSNAHLGDANKLLVISQWGDLQLGNTGYNFDYAKNLKITAVDAPNLTGTTNLANTFSYCSNLGNSGNFNKWNVSTITNMRMIFFDASDFNQSISSWNVSHVTDMSYMFYGTSTFNQPLSNWNVSQVTTMESMFAGASAFNQSLNNWNVSQVTDMFSMFYSASAFNQPIGSWNTSSVTTMDSMFYSASSFNQPIGSWNTSKVSNMQWMFGYAQAFNQPLDNWNVSHVINIESMFYNASAFNQPLEKWDVSNINYMDYMFDRARSFNQDLGGWNVAKLQSAMFIFYLTNLSVSNYSNLLIGWSKLNLQHGVMLGCGSLQYNSTAATARQSIITNFGWKITDGGQSIPSTPSTTSLTVSTSASSKSAISQGKSSPVSLISVILGLSIITALRVTKYRKRVK